MHLKKYFDRTFWLYLVIGILNFLVCTALMFFLFNFCGFSEHLAPVVNYALGSIIWLLACHYVLFREQRLTVQLMIRFLLEVVLCYLIAFYLITPPVARWLLSFDQVWALLDKVVAADKVAGNMDLVVGTLVYAILNYFGQRCFVFNAKMDMHRKHRTP